MNTIQCLDSDLFCWEMINYYNKLTQLQKIITELVSVAIWHHLTIMSSNYLFKTFILKFDCVTIFQYLWFCRHSNSLIISQMFLYGQYQRSSNISPSPILSWSRIIPILSWSRNICTNVNLSTHSFSIISPSLHGRLLSMNILWKVFQKGS